MSEDVALVERRTPGSWRSSSGAGSRWARATWPATSYNGRSVNLPDHVRRLYAGREPGRATYSSLRQLPTPQSTRRPRHRCW